MCNSTLHRVIELIGEKSVLATDVNGDCHQVSLLALDGPAPAVGTWLVVHSRYAIERVDESDAQVALAELRRVRAAVSNTAEHSWPKADG